MGRMRSPAKKTQKQGSGTKGLGFEVKVVGSLGSLFPSLQSSPTAQEQPRGLLEGNRVATRFHVTVARTNHDFNTARTRSTTSTALNVTACISAEGVHVPHSIAPCGDVHARPALRMLPLNLSMPEPLKDGRAWEE